MSVISSGTSVLQTVSVVDALVAELRSRVLDGDYETGGTLVESDVAERYGVSRPTARAAITALVYEGLLRRTANKTARVARLTQTDMDDLFRIRIPLEERVLHHLAVRGEMPIAAMTAAVDQLRHVATDAPFSEFVLPDLHFHSVMVDAVGSPRLSRMYESLRGEIHLCMVQTATALGHSRILEEHAAVLEVAASGDAETAVGLMHDHLCGAQQVLRNRLA